MTKTLLDVAKALALAAAFFLLVQALLQNYQVLGESMEPNLRSGQHLIVNKAAYMSLDADRLSRLIPFYDLDDASRIPLFGKPQRGDVVVVVSPQPSAKRLVKRVVGLPGDTLAIEYGVVMINGRPLSEPYVRGLPADRDPLPIPPDHYFVLGDNRPHSNDSNSFGPVHRSNILGKAWLVYWPPRHFGTVDGFAVEPEMQP